jgi:N-acyl-D-amino-acid deacylase
MAVDLVIRGGTVYDGTGAEGVRTDVLVEGDRVVALAEAPAETPARVLDATGQAVVPGFVNVLSHAWGSLQLDGSGASDLLQGVTTEVFGEAFSLGPSNGDFDALVKGFFSDQPGVELLFDRLSQGLDHLVGRGVAPNVASFIGGHNLRVLGAGFDDRRLEPAELDRLRGLVAEDMQEGALGIGTALIYPPGSFADTEELTALCEVVGRYDGVYISHMRSEGDQFLECLDELIGIGQRAQCRAEVYHLKAAGRHNWHKMAQAIERIERARAAGQPVTANMYPYTAGGTALAASVPPRFHVGGPDAFRQRLEDPVQRKEMVVALHERSDAFENLFLAAGADGILFGADLDDGTGAAGKRLSNLAADLGLEDPAEALLEVLRRSPSTGVLYFIAEEANVELGLSQPWVSIGSDAEAMRLQPADQESSSHPRTFGTFARFLGHYVRDREVASFADAIHRMTSLPAETLGLRARGRLAPGCFADVVVLDPSTVADTATYEAPQSYAVGVRHVLVNGQPVVLDGALTDARPGRRIGRSR